MANWYNKGKARCLNGLTWTSDTIKFMLMKSAYTFDADHNFVSDISTNEISVSGYSRQTAGTKSVGKDDTADKARAICADITFGTLAAGQTAQGAVCFRFGTVDGDSELLFYVPTNAVALAGNSVALDLDQTAGAATLS